MSEALIVRRGGSGKLYAVIAVSYPAGSTCTCTNGTKTLKAKDTSGKALFSVPSAGTWTVSCTEGTDTASKAVSITAAGQCEAVGLHYELILFDGTNGGDNTAVTGGWKSDCGSGSIKIASSAIQINVTEQQNTNYAVVTKNKIDVTNYSTLYVEARLITYRWGTPAVGLYSSTARGNTSGSSKLSWSTTEQSSYVIKTLDISKATGSYYIGSKDTDPQFYIRKLWLV